MNEILTYPIAFVFNLFKILYLILAVIVELPLKLCAALVILIVAVFAAAISVIAVPKSSKLLNKLADYGTDWSFAGFYLVHYVLNTVMYNFK